MSRPDRQFVKDYLRGTIVIRTHDIHKKLYITLFLLSIFGPDYYVLP